MLNKIIVLLLMLFSPSSADWTSPIRISSHGGYATPQIISNEDTLYVAAMTSTGRDKICFIKSTDMGFTWSQERTLSDTVNTGDISFPQIFRHNQNILILWRFYFLQTDSYNIGCRLSINGGRSWRPISSALNQGLTGSFYFGVSSFDSVVSITYCTEADDSLGFYFLNSTNFGQSWSNSRELFKALQNSQINQISIGDTIHVVWDGRFDPNLTWEIRYLRSTDNGSSWSDNQLLSSNDLVRSFLPSICANQSGTIHVVWMDGKYSPYIDTGDILDRYTTDGGSTWSPENQATFTHFAWDSDVTSKGDTIHIVWNDEGTGLGHRSVYYTQSIDNGLSWSEAYWIDGSLDDSWDPAIEVTNGRFYTTWGDGTYNPDTTSHWGLYFSRWDPEPDAIDGDLLQQPIENSLSAYPNPFNSSTIIEYSFKNIGKIDIYDVQGRLIRSLLVEGGENGKIIWDATDAMGNKVSSGIYFAKASAGTKFRHYENDSAQIIAPI